MVTDYNAFVFSLESNKRLEKPMRFNLKENKGNNIFKLYDKNISTLFRIGSELDIKKENNGMGRCEQEEFEYNGLENVLIGYTGDFRIKRIQVWQMKEIEELEEERLPHKYSPFTKYKFLATVSYEF